jgi:hypothetical protein
MHTRPSSLRSSISGSELQLRISTSSKKTFSTPLGLVEHLSISSPLSPTAGQQQQQQQQQQSNTKSPLTTVGGVPPSTAFPPTPLSSAALSGPAGGETSAPVDVGSLVPTFRPKTSPTVSSQRSGPVGVLPPAPKVSGLPLSRGLSQPQQYPEDLSILKLLGENSPVAMAASAAGMATGGASFVASNSPIAGMGSGHSFLRPLVETPLRVPSQPPQPPSARARVTIGDTTFVGNTVIVDTAQQAEEVLVGKTPSNSSAAVGGCSPTVVAVALPAGKLDRLNLDQRFLKELPALQLPSGAAADVKTLTALLSQVKLLNLQNNEITTLSVPPPTAGGGSSVPLLHPTPLSCFANVVYLDLYNNRLKGLSGLEQLRKLRVLMIGKNRLSDLSQMYKCVMSPALEVLDAHGNQLTTFFASPSTSHDGSEAAVDRAKIFPQLRVVNVAGNKLTSLDGIQHLPALCEFNARRNRVTSLPANFSAHTKNIKKLFLSSNNFGLATKEDLIAQLCRCKAMEELTLDSNPCFQHISLLDDSSRSELVSSLESLRSLNGVAITDQDRLELNRKRGVAVPPAAPGPASGTRDCGAEEDASQTPESDAPLSTRSALCVSPTPDNKCHGAGGKDTRDSDVPSSSASSTIDTAERPTNSPVVTSPTTSARRPSKSSNQTQISSISIATTPPQQAVMVSPAGSPLTNVSSPSQCCISLSDVVGRAAQPRGGGGALVQCPAVCERLVLHSVTPEALRAEFAAPLHAHVFSAIQSVPSCVEVLLPTPLPPDLRIWELGQLLTMIRKQWPSTAILLQPGGNYPFDWKPIVSPILSGQAAMGPPAVNMLWGVYKPTLSSQHSASSSSGAPPKVVEHFGQEVVARGARHGELLRSVDETLFASECSLISTSSSLLSAVLRSGLQQQQQQQQQQPQWDTSDRRRMYHSCSALVSVPRTKAAMSPAAGGPLVGSSWSTPQTPTEMSGRSSAGGAGGGTSSRQHHRPSVSSRPVTHQSRRSSVQQQQQQQQHKKPPPARQQPDEGAPNEEEE